MSYKSFPFLTAPSLRGHVNSPTPAFGNIKLTEAVIDLIIARKLIHDPMN